MEEQDKIIEIMREFVVHVNEINKRLVVAIVAVVVSMCILGGFVSYVYFTADYYYPNIISNIESDNNANANGGD